MKKLIYSTCALILLSCSNPQLSTKTTLLASNTEAHLQAVSIVNDQTAWISGHEGTFLRSTTGGESWEVFTHPTGDTLQFRDVHGFDEDRAVLMTSGPGPLSRIFTFQSPAQWEENFVMQDSLGFLDCMDFWDDQRGIAYGDAIDSYPYILLSTDGGQSWQRADTTFMPKAGRGEGGFAASGTCVTTGRNGKAWIATGAGGNCRFLVTEDYGLTWNEVSSPLVSGEAAGNTSVSFIGDIGVVTGGDLLKQSEYTKNCAFSKDGGRSWTLSNQPKTVGPFYGSAITSVDGQTFTFACGPQGIDYSADLGETWSTIDSLNYWAISLKGKMGYAAGSQGKILKISLQP